MNDPHLPYRYRAVHGRSRHLLSLNCSRRFCHGARHHWSNRLLQWVHVHVHVLLPLAAVPALIRECWYCDSCDAAELRPCLRCAWTYCDDDHRFPVFYSDCLCFRSTCGRFSTISVSEKNYSIVSISLSRTAAHPNWRTAAAGLWCSHLLRSPDLAWLARLLWLGHQIWTLLFWWHLLTSMSCCRRPMCPSALSYSYFCSSLYLIESFLPISNYFAMTHNTNDFRRNFAFSFRCQNSQFPSRHWSRRKKRGREREGGSERGSGRKLKTQRMQQQIILRLWHMQLSSRRATKWQTIAAFVLLTHTVFKTPKW